MRSIQQTAPRLALSCLAFACMSGGLLAAPEFRWEESETSLALLNGERVVWRHIHDAKQSKPCFHPLSTLDGTVLTELRPADHRWHLATWFSWKFINGLNYWEENPKTGLSAGLTEIGAVTVKKGADFSAVIEFRISYNPPGKAPLLEELRTLRVGAPDAAGNYVIDWKSEFTAQEAGDLGRTPLPGEEGGKAYGGYAGLSVRVSKALRHWSYRDSEGRENGSHGKAARWLEFAGKLPDGGEAGISMFDHPSNPGYPTKWYENRGMPYFSPALLFDKGMSLAKGEKLSLSYRILVQSRRGDLSPWLPAFESAE